ncbi:MAG: inosine/xanthosine triphosphatase [Candidatus Aenigmarchaeota archaeon]|nr:inosine/xanthosine triphosphatase [Candidatus Aenigmarchaeota archaeon]
MKIAVGSKNPVKLNAAENVMKKIFGNFELMPVDVDSGVGDMPMSEEETIRGATNRAVESVKKTGSDLGIGMEGGIAEKLGKYFLINWCAVADKNEDVAIGCGTQLELPDNIVNKVREGKELGIVMDEITGINDTKQKMGCIGILTGGLTDRQTAWEIALIYAMAKRLAPKFYK